MKVLLKPTSGEITEKKSTFICYLQPVSNEEEAQNFIKEIKKKHYDARHNCSAYIISGEPESGTPDILRSSDDGEPGGTAGRPMLEVLQHEDLTNVCAVVTRYFGGVLLGTGGLVRAYQGAVKAALESAETLSRIEGYKAEIKVPYDLLGKVEYYLNEHKELHREDTAYNEDVVFTVLVPESQLEPLTRDMTELSSGKIKVDPGELTTYTIDSNTP